MKNLKTLLSISSWLTIFFAVFVIPYAIFSILVVYKSDLAIITQLVGILYTASYIFVMYVFKKYLNIKLKIFSLDKIIILLVATDIISTTISLLSLSKIFSSGANLVVSILMLFTLGALSIIYGIKVINLNNDLFGQNKIYGYLNIVTGFCLVSVIFIPIAILTMIASYIYFGIILDKASKSIK